MPKGQTILETERLIFREFVEEDIDILHELLSDPVVMRYYPSVLSRKEAQGWLDRILVEYKENGFSWWAVHTKEGEFVGQVCLVLRDMEGQQTVLLGYMLRKECWGKGYATKAARAVISYGFERYAMDRIDCVIRPENAPSLGVAARLGLAYERRLWYHSYEHELFYTTPSSWNA